jgi:uncharacterized protein YjiS (DUF1127 family)
MTLRFSEAILRLLLPELLADWLRYRNERREIMALDDWVRRDIGLSAEEIHYIYGSFRRWRARVGSRPPSPPTAAQLDHHPLAQQSCRG